MFLFALMVFTSNCLLLGAGVSSGAPIIVARYILLLSSIIPISLRVNLDLAKIYYCWQIGHDDQIPDTVAKNTNIPEELGRVQIFLTDKTGTLTKNVMKMNKLKLIGEARSWETDQIHT